MSVLVICEPQGGALSSESLVTITAATHLSQDVHVLVATHDGKLASQFAATLSGVNKVLSVINPCFEHPLAEDIAGLVLSIASQYTHILAPANSFGKNLLPRIAAKLDSSQISDITKIIADDTFVRPIYAGNAYITVRSSDKIKLITVRTTAFDSAQVGTSSATISELPFSSTNTRSFFISQEKSVSERPQLGGAKKVISGGRGLQNAENFQIIMRLADQLGAAIGASRAAVDAGFIANEYQVGQTGKVVAPDLYIAIGISGAIQHIAGISDSKVIVAINKDADAPIFDVADYGLVADFFEILPALESALEQLGYKKVAN